MREWGKKVVITLECGLGTFILLERTVQPLEAPAGVTVGLQVRTAIQTPSLSLRHTLNPLYGECKLGSLTAYHEGY